MIIESSHTQLRGIMEEIVKNHPSVVQRQPTQKPSQVPQSSTSSNQVNEPSIEQWKTKCKVQYKERQTLKIRVKELEGLNSRLQNEILDTFG